MHARLAALQVLKRSREFAAGEEQATLMRGLRDPMQQRGVVFVAWTHATCCIVLLQQRFQAVQHEQTALGLQALQQHVNVLIYAGWQAWEEAEERARAGSRRAGPGKRGIAHRTKDHRLESGAIWRMRVTARADLPMPPMPSTLITWHCSCTTLQIN